jgi:hypothetical protein
MAFLGNGFPRTALRVGLTATPDYNAKRRLAHHFPKLIFEVSLYEAFEMELTAPLRLFVAEVDVDASKVRLIAGDYDADSLGRLMSAAPIFRAAELFRYHEENRFTPALFSCSSRRQALDLKAYLDRHRPLSCPEPEVILGETPEDSRIDILNRFEDGTIDTLIQVGVLTEGWNSPRCKLLIDIAPSLSRVRATQKYFRVMTKSGNAEARIYVIIPAHLSAMPVLPTDLFGNPLEDYECGTLVSISKSSGARRRQQYLPTPIEGVRLRKRVVFEHGFEKPTLDKRNLPALRRVVASSEAFDVEKPCGFLAFHSLHFDHRKFVGTGGLLLDHCGVRDRFSYHDFMTRLFPEAMAGLLLGIGDPLSQRFSNDSDLARLLDDGNEPAASRWYGWVALGGHLEDTALSPEEAVIRRETYSKLWMMIGGLKPRERSLLLEYFGLDRKGVCTLRELGDTHEISSSRVAQIIAKAIRKLRYRNWKDSILL